MHEPRLNHVQCIASNGLHRLAYAEWGDVDNPSVLICAHGLTRVGRDFDDLARALASDYRVVCPDMPGRGRSSWLRDPMLYQVPVYVADMITLIARLGTENVHWFGTSMGGMIGMALAALSDTPITRLVLNDVGPVVEGAALARIGEYLGRPVHFANLAQAEVYIRQVSAPFGALTDSQWRHLTEIALRPGPNDGYTLHYDPAIAVPFQAVLGASGVPADQLLWHIYDRVRCPTLAVRGAQSDLLSPATHRAMGERGPHATLVEIPDAGHAPPFMAPEQIEIVREFLLGGQ